MPKVLCCAILELLFRQIRPTVSSRKGTVQKRKEPQASLYFITLYERLVDWKDIGLYTNILSLIRVVIRIIHKISLHLCVKISPTVNLQFFQDIRSYLRWCHACTICFYRTHTAVLCCKVRGGLYVGPRKKVVLHDQWRFDSFAVTPIRDCYYFFIRMFAEVYHSVHLLAAIHELGIKYQKEFDMPKLRLVYNQRQGFHIVISESDLQQNCLPNVFLQVFSTTLLQDIGSACVTCVHSCSVEASSASHSLKHKQFNEVLLLFRSLKEGKISAVQLTSWCRYVQITFCN